jgi:hypothetical protein
MRAKEYEFNAEFDLSLRPRWGGLETASEARQIDEMALHAVLIGGREDSVRLPSAPPEEFFASLDRYGLETPYVTVRPSVRPRQQLVPFGWNGAAAELNRVYARPVSHPPLEVVRRSNSRTFSARLEQDLGEPGFQLGAFGSVAEIESHLRGAGSPIGGWIAKSDHGNAGLGNRRLRSRELGEVDRRWLRSTLDEDDRVLLEPWVRRLADLCTTFDLGVDGNVVDLTIHEVVNTADGAFIGALFDADSEVVARCRDELERAAATVAGRLHGDGYFGPVCLDAFVWQDGGRPRLRPLVDLNARLHMSRPARRLWKRWRRARMVYWRFFTRRKLRLPEGPGEMEEALGDDAFDSVRMRGILVTSPLWVAQRGRRRYPHKLGVLFVGSTRDEVTALECRFREFFER